MSDVKKTRYEEIQWHHAMQSAFDQTTVNSSTVLPLVVKLALNKLGFPSQHDVKSGKTLFYVEKVNNSMCVKHNEEYQHTANVYINLNDQTLTVPVYMTSPMKHGSDVKSTFKAGTADAIEIKDADSYDEIADAMHKAIKVALYRDQP